MAVQHGDSRAEVRGFSTLAALYEETGQTVKAQNYYSKVIKRSNPPQTSLVL